MKALHTAYIKKHITIALTIKKIVIIVVIACTGLGDSKNFNVQMIVSQYS